MELAIRSHPKRAKVGVTAEVTVILGSPATKMVTVANRLENVAPNQNIRWKPVLTAALVIFRTGQSVARITRAVTAPNIQSKREGRFKHFTANKVGNSSQKS